MCPSYCSSLALQTWLQDPTLAPGVQLLLLVQSNPPSASPPCASPHTPTHIWPRNNLLPAACSWRHRDLCLVSRFG